MKTIKFSYPYSKLMDEHNDLIETAKLIEVIPIALEAMSVAFKSYDTDDGHFVLPKKGEYLMLIFQKPKPEYLCSSDLFTTLRRSTPQKLTYYKSAIGETFNVELVC